MIPASRVYPLAWVDGLYVILRPGERANPEAHHAWSWSRRYTYPCTESEGRAVPIKGRRTEWKGGTL